MATKQDIPVIIHNGKRGLLTVEDGRLDVLQLSADGRPPKHLMSAPVRLLLRAELGPAPTTSVPPTPTTPTTPAQPSKNKNRTTPEEAKRTLDIHALVQKGAKSHHLHYTKIRVLVEPPNFADAEQWVDHLMAAAYPVSKPYRNVLLIVNPVGGKGKGMAIAKHTIVPILEAAGCKVDMRVTDHQAHAEEICREADLSNVDVIAVASGDGGYYEAFNGLASRPDARKAMQTPIAPLPTGSACAACTNIFGPKDTFNVPLATLNAIKGQPMPIDLQSVTLLPSKERRVSFLSVALGLMVELDIGTENLRWMGDARFMYGYVRGVVQNKICKALIKLDIADDDKEKMAREARESALKERGTTTIGAGTDPLQLIRGVQSMSPASEAMAKGNGHTNGYANGDSSGPSETPGATAEDSTATPVEAAAPAVVNGDGTADGEDALPPARLLEPTDSWVSVDTSGGSRRGSKSPGSANAWEAGDSMVFLYAGLQPHVSRDLNQFPVSRPGTGVIDVALQKTIPRGTLLKAAGDSASGNAFWLDSQVYYKVRAYTVENLDKKSQPKLTIDGEGFDWDTFHVEVLPRAASFLALDGHYYQGEFLEQAPSAGPGKAMRK